MKCGILLAIVALGACSSREANVAQLGDVRYDAPSGWLRTDTHTPTDLITTWMPRVNVHKESLEVIRAEVSRAVTRNGGNDLAPLLVRAQSELHDAHVGRPVRASSDGGLVGFRVEADFTPVGAHESYHRIHAVLLDHKGVLVHVLYTGAGGGQDLNVFNTVVRSLAHGEA